MYMTEKIIDLGSKSLEVSIHGTGKTVIVIETGMGCSWYDWCKIISEISKKATVLAYHRAGYGRSTLGEEERSTKYIAEDLNKLLQKEGITSNVILVGHSFGGLCVQHYASLFPQMVSGMILIDSNAVDEYKMDELREGLISFKSTFSKDKIVENWRELSSMSKEELEKKIKPELLLEQKRFTEEIQKRILEFQGNPKMYSAMASELELMANSGQEIKRGLKQLDIPLKVLARDMQLGVKWNINAGISSDDSIEFETLWQELVANEAEISKRGEFFEVKDSKHSIYRTNPEVVVDAINDVIDQVGLI